MHYFLWSLLFLLLAGGNGINASSSSGLPILPSSRASIPSFIVMDVLRRAIELESQGNDICHMEVGQPSTGASKLVLAAAKQYLEDSILGYTNALGIDELRKKIAQHVYKEKYGTEISPERIVITTGSSGKQCKSLNLQLLSASPISYSLILHTHCPNFCLFVRSKRGLCCCFWVVLIWEITLL